MGSLLLASAVFLSSAGELLFTLEHIVYHEHIVLQTDIYFLIVKFCRCIFYKMGN